MATLFADNPNAVCIPAILVCPVPPLPNPKVPEIFPATVAVVALPIKLAVMVPAAKSPFPSLFTMVLIELLDVAAVIVLFNDVILIMLEAILVFNVVIDTVLAVILEVIAASAVVALVTSEVKLDVADVILVSKVAMVDEFTPPTVFTVGEVAVPLKSPAN